MPDPTWEDFTPEETTPSWDDFTPVATAESPVRLRDFLGLGPANPTPVSSEQVQPQGWIERSMQSGEPPNFGEFMTEPAAVLPRIEEKSGENTREYVERSLGNSLRGLLSGGAVPINAAGVPAIATAVPGMVESVKQKLSTPGQKLEGGIDAGLMLAGGIFGAREALRPPKLLDLVPKPPEPKTISPAAMTEEVVTGTPFIEKPVSGPPIEGGDITSGTTPRDAVPESPLVETPTPERIVAASIRRGDEVVSGVNHADAFSKTGEAMDAGTVPESWELGFQTNTGRFVSSAEARDISVKSRQLRNPEHPFTGVTAEDLILPETPPAQGVVTPHARMSPDEYAASGGSIGPSAERQSVLNEAIKRGEPVNADLYNIAMYDAPKGYVRDGNMYRPKQRGSAEELAAGLDVSTYVPSELAALAEDITPYSPSRNDVASHMGPIFSPEGTAIEIRFTDPVKAAEARTASQPQRDLLRQRYGDTVTVYRAARPKGGKYKRSIFSWTLDPKIAESHLGESGTVLVTKTIPVDDVLWFGNKFESEILLRDSGINDPVPTRGTPEAAANYGIGTPEWEAQVNPNPTAKGVRASPEELAKSPWNRAVLTTDGEVLVGDTHADLVTRTKQEGKTISVRGFIDRATGDFFNLLEFTRKQSKEQRVAQEALDRKISEQAGRTPEAAVPKTGEPITMRGYHATDKPIESDLNPDTWFSNKSEATDFYYSGEEYGKKFEADVTFENPLVVTEEQFASTSHGPTYWLDKAYKEGHDGVILTEIQDGDMRSTVFAPTMKKGTTPADFEGRIKLREPTAARGGTPTETQGGGTPVVPEDGTTPSVAEPVAAPEQVRPEFIVPPEDAPYAGTSLKKAVVDTEREAAGLDPIEAAEVQHQADLVKDAVELHNKNRNVGKDLVSKIVDERQRAITEQDAATLLVERQKTMNERTALEDRLAKGDKTAGPLLDALEEHLNRLDHAQREAGRTWGRLGNMYQRLILEDFSLAAMESKMRSATEGSLPEPMRMKIKGSHRKIKNAQEEVAGTKALAEFEQSLAEAQASEGFSLIKFFNEAEARAAARKLERRGKLYSDPFGAQSIAHLADEAIIGAAHIARGIAKFPEWSKAMREKFGEGIKPYLTALYAKSKQLHDQAAKLAPQDRYSMGLVKKLVRRYETLENKIAQLKGLAPKKEPKPKREQVSDHDIEILETELDRIKAVDKQRAEQLRVKENLERQVARAKGLLPKTEKKPAKSITPDLEIEILQNELLKVKEIAKEAKEAARISNIPGRYNAKRQESIANRIKELARRKAAGETTPPKRTTPPKTRATELAEGKLLGAENEFKAWVLAEQHKNRSALAKAGAGLSEVRGLVLGSDVGQLTRQGLFSWSRPHHAVRATAQAMKSMFSQEAMDVWTVQMRDKEINGQLAAPIRKQSGLQLTDTLNHPEELVITRIFRHIPDFKVGGKTIKLSNAARSLERFQVTFINDVRMRMLDAGIKAGLSPTELAHRAEFINNATGRGNFKRVPEALNVLMTSPRYEASRWAMLTEPFKNVGRLAKEGVKGNLDRGSLANLQDMAVTAAEIYGLYKLAEVAAGYKVNWNPYSSDFLKARKGDDVWDMSAGLAPRLRDVMRLYAGWAHPSYQQNWGKTLGNMGVRTINPAIRTITDQSAAAVQKYRGDNEVKLPFTGFTAKDEETGFITLAPLIIQSMNKALDEGYGAAAWAGAREFVGSSVSNYPEPKDEGAKVDLGY